MSTDTDMLEEQVRCLENENRQLRETLRDKFAMTVLNGMFSHSATGMTESVAPQVAAVCYGMADYMLEARAK